jgi:hypothetical protein
LLDLESAFDMAGLPAKLMDYRKEKGNKKLLIYPY